MLQSLNTTPVLCYGCSDNVDVYMRLILIVMFTPYIKMHLDLILGRQFCTLNVLMTH